jgi:hypothetical protein
VSVDPFRARWLEACASGPIVDLSTSAGDPAEVFSSDAADVFPVSPGCALLMTREWWGSRGLVVRVRAAFADHLITQDALDEAARAVERIVGRHPGPPAYYSPGRPEAVWLIPV